MAGNQYFSDGETLIAIDTAAIETQRKSFELAFKIRVIYAPNKGQALF